MFCFSWGELLPVADFHLIVLPDLVHCGWQQWPVHFFFTAFKADFTWLPRRLWVKYLRSIKGNLFLTATTRFIRENLTWHIGSKFSSSDQLSSALVHFLSIQHICGDLWREEPICLIITVSVVLSFLPLSPGWMLTYQVPLDRANSQIHLHDEFLPMRIALNETIKKVLYQAAVGCSETHQVPLASTVVKLSFSPTFSNKSFCFRMIVRSNN